MELKPSEIFYSQDSIMNKFGDYTQHGDTLIGETLDQLLCGQCNIGEIPKISVVDINGKWFTTDNRRLWVFRKAEELGFLRKIEAGEKFYIKEDKMTTDNGGTSVRVRGRGGPGGRVWKTLKPKPRKTNRRARNSNTSYYSNYTANSIPNPPGSRNYDNYIPTYKPPNRTQNRPGHNWSNIPDNQARITKPTPEVYSISRYNYASNYTTNNRYTNSNPTMVNTADQITPGPSTGYHNAPTYNTGHVRDYTLGFNYRETDKDKNCCCVIL